MTKNILIAILTTAVRAAAIVLAAQRKTEEAQSKLEACKSLKK